VFQVKLLRNLPANLHRSINARRVSTLLIHKVNVEIVQILTIICLNYVLCLKVSLATNERCRGHLIYQVVVPPHKSYTVTKLMQLLSKKS